jgi:hypothetical protein
MTERQLIDEAFGATIKNLYSKFNEAYTTAVTPADQQKAEQVFRNGVLHERSVRDRALALLP